MRVTNLIAGLALAAAIAAPAAAKQGDVLVRLRAIMVSPNESSGPVLPSFPGAGVSVNDAYAPELDFTYMATDHLGVELVLATDKHTISGTGTLAGVGKLASTWVLPPTLVLQYHFLPAGHVRPYVGAGINYTIFYSRNASAALESAVGPTDVSLKSSFGYAVQAGVDVDISEKVFLNLDVKYIDMTTRAKLTSGALVNQVAVDINPLVFGVGLGMRY
ncbi:OmpW/AlkL family protein [Sandarakinorhabdus sp. DWP1-3-1]|uniref:OmpW/AlkL family protein n=1 Tax=Sandarakinorhabdus sp. DWP1-3-1 TaxID=2804627 RepID=UPI003CE98523